MPQQIDHDATDEQLYADLPDPVILKPADLLSDYQPNILAPLVRCSKLPFRHLTSLYETHITHTPMILAEEFSRAQVARISDFSTSLDERGVFWMEKKKSRKGKEAEHEREGHSYSHPEDDRPRQLQTQDGSDHFDDTGRLPRRLPPTPVRPSANHDLVRGCMIAQFASPNPTSLADAAELISPYVDGLDLNCGCPQRWAYNEGIGCALLRKPELVRDMVRCVKDRMGWEWPVSIKIRVDPELKLTEQLIKTALQANISHLTIHGRTRHQSSADPVNLDGIKFAVETVNGQVPCSGNGDIWELNDAVIMRETTGVSGVMGARGLLANPALFAGYKTTPSHCVSQFISLSSSYGLIHPLFHRHLAYMLESQFSRAEKIWFNSLGGPVGAIDWLESRGLGWRKQSERGTIWDARRGREVVQAI
ncbi:tRNA-dihydrouridine synthase 4 [Kwoniella heveanensis CBS 569]|nr:tRNA-dihydrouridine synthase 4 [Kwoniella heveanensis CBS 569]